MTFIPHTEIEIIHDIQRPTEIYSVLFDFDGTISLIREGWQGVMVPMMVEILQALNTQETVTELTELVTEFVDRLTGKQTIYQMIELCEQIKQRSGEPKEALSYKHMYLSRLWERIEHRVHGLKKGSISTKDMTVPGAHAFLAQLEEMGLTCYLASGTDEPFVLDEAEALGVASFFETRIFGALDEYERFSKAQVIQDILQRHQLNGKQLLAFGDGFVEIEETKRVGGIAVGVASDETQQERINEWKRTRLIEAGADFIVPDLDTGPALLEYLGVHSME